MKRFILLILSCCFFFSGCIDKSAEQTGENAVVKPKKPTPIYSGNKFLRQIEGEREVGIEDVDQVFFMRWVVLTSSFGAAILIVLRWKRVI